MWTQNACARNVPTADLICMQEQKKERDVIGHFVKIKSMRSCERAKWEEACKMGRSMHSGKKHAKWEEACKVGRSMQSGKKHAKWEEACKVGRSMQSGKKHAKW
ncbi:hypothetical protein POVCU2_0046170 [Plasmodium ovale curtisi]|uniref:Uncharacterized protein n=1 Tax=Plasmodium ovale curtisi TaxID=864141 RepID=A0A1A8WA30_PLAOA|nr:hypothetical protein POVCU2_0046170 [Plasmodium ovale curtisi]